MKPSEIRKELHKYVDEADKGTLHFMKEALALYKTQRQNESKEDESHDYPWAPTDEELIATIEKAEEDLKNGNYLTHEEVVAQLKTLRAKV